MPTISRDGNLIFFKDLAEVRNELPITFTNGNSTLIKASLLPKKSLPTYTADGRLIFSRERLLLINPISTLKLPLLEGIGNSFLYTNKSLTDLDLPLVKDISYSFLQSNKSLKSINLPSVRGIGSNFLHDNTSLTALDLPLLEKVSNRFLFYNESLAKLNMPSATGIYNYFLFNNNVYLKLQFEIKKLNQYVY